MRTGIFTLDKTHLEMMNTQLPDYVVDRAADMGYFTIGAVVTEDDEEMLVGAAQFYINITEEGECFAEIIYVYVREDYRREGIGAKLLERVSRILKKSGVNTSMTLIPASVRSTLQYELSPEEIESFFKDSSYIAMSEGMAAYSSVLFDVFPKLDENQVKRFVRLTNR